MAAQPENPFDLSKKKTDSLARRAIKSTTYTEEEKATLLQGYVSIPARLWPLIRNGTHMRYVTKEGLFRIGGFVQTNPAAIVTTDTGKTVRVFRLQNNFMKGGANHHVWSASYDNTAEVYVRPDVTAFLVHEKLEEAVAGLNANIKKLAEYTKKLEKKIDALEGRR